VTDHLIERSDVDSDGNDIGLSVGEARLRRHFDSLGQTILSLWQSLSGGIDWSEVADPLTSEVGFLLGLGFAAFIAFSLLALMNVVTGVFVQTALHSAEQEEEEFLTSQIIQLFQKCKDNSERTGPRGHSARSADIWGCITEQELEERLGDPALAKEWSNISVSADEAQYVFALLDVEEKGEVQFEEFLSACLRLKGNAKSLDMLIQLQESRHNAKVIEEFLTRIEDSVSNLPQYLQDKMGQESPKSQDGKDGRKAFPRSPRHSGSEAPRSPRDSVGNTRLVPGIVSPRHSDSQM
jgi:Ca2+-binding EF-hand superfamily protein